jgi:hypothetical protein
MHVQVKSLNSKFGSVPSDNSKSCNIYRSGWTSSGMLLKRPGSKMTLVKERIHLKIIPMTAVKECLHLRSSQMEVLKAPMKSSPMRVVKGPLKSSPLRVVKKRLHLKSSWMMAVK